MAFLDDLANFGKAVVAAPVKMINTGWNQNLQIQNTALAQFALATKNDKLFQATQKSQRLINKQNDNGGLLGLGSFYGSKDWTKGDPLTGAKKIGGGTLETAATVLPFAKGGSVAYGLGKGALKSAAPKLAGQGALYGGMFSAGNQLRENGGIDPLRLAGDTAIGGVANVAIPAGLRGVKLGAQKAMPAVTNAAKNVAPATQAIKQQVLASRPVGYFFGDKAAVQAANGGRVAATAPVVDQMGNQAAKVPTAVTPKLTPKTQQTPGFVENRFTARAKAGDQNVSDEVMGAVNGQHRVRNTQELIDRGNAEADTYKNVNDLINAAHERLAVRPGDINDEDLSFLAQAIERADAAGNHDAATAIHDAVSEHAVAAGQRVQAMSIFYRRTPEGMVNKAMRDIKRALPKGAPIDPELRARLKVLAQSVKDAPDGDAKDLAIGMMQKEVQKNIPTEKLQGALAVWKAGLLSGPITHAGNAASNAVFGGLKTISDIPATAADTLLSKFTGNRTKALTMQGRGSGFVQGAKNAKQTMKTGVDLRNIIDGKYEGHGEINFKNPVWQTVFGKPSNLVFRALGAGDQPFYYSALKNSLADQAKAAGINRGLHGRELQNFIDETVAKPPTNMASQADREARYAVLGEDRAISNSISKFVGKHPSLQIVVPFTKVPTNFLAQTLDYTPVGAVTKAVQAIRSARKGEGIDQRMLSEAIGKSTTGTALIFLGAELANSGMLSGTYPTDPKEQARWKAQGIQPNSIKIGDTWYSMNYLGPAGILFQAGKNYRDAAANGDNAAMQSIAGIGKSLAGQSFLTGFSGFANALNDPGRYGQNLINQQAGSIMPNWLKTVSNITDPYQRDINSPADAIQNGIPIAREGLNIKQDVYGNKLTQRTDPFNLALNPLRPSNARSSNTLNEVERLHNVDTTNKDLQVTPTPVDKTLSVDGKKIKLNAQQRYDLQNKIGSQTQQRWSEFIKTPEYKSLSNADKATALDNLRKDTAAIAQRDYVQGNNLAQYKKELTDNQKNLKSGNSSIAQYAKAGASDGSSSSGSVAINNSISPSSKDFLKQYNTLSSDQRDKLFNTQNDAEFKYNLAKYENDMADGKLSKAQQIRAEADLQRDKVGANFPKEIRELYSLSKAQLQAFADESPENAALANQVAAYGQALVDAGLYKYNKFGGGSGKGGSKGKSQSQASAISAAAAGSKAAANAKVNGRSSGGSFQNKISRPGLQAYRKPAKTTVRSNRT